MPKNMARAEVVWCSGNNCLAASWDYGVGEPYTPRKAITANKGTDFCIRNMLIWEDLRHNQRKRRWQVI
jgi:hypothetical protein